MELAKKILENSSAIFLEKVVIDPGSAERRGKEQSLMLLFTFLASVAKCLTNIGMQQYLIAQLPVKLILRPFKSFAVCVSFVGYRRRIP